MGQDRILITGGSGSLGPEIAKRLLANGHSVMVFSRDRGRQIDRCPPGCELEVGEIEDAYAVLDVFRQYQPTHFVHCAANKYVGVCERNPGRALGCNLAGLQNVLSAAEIVAVQGGVFVSSDKACDQTVYGMTKLLGERLVTRAAVRTGALLASVRLGNLIGSAGSVTALFQKAQAERSPVQLHVTEGRAAKRFVMSPQGAASCVLEALAMQFPGAVIVWQMPIMDMRTLAQRLAPDCEVQEVEVYPGLCDQVAIRRAESPCVRIDGDRFILDRSMPPLGGPTWEYSTETVSALSEVETSMWLRGVMTIPVDDAHKVCG